MEIILQYFESCPNWRTTAAHLSRLIRKGLDAAVGYELIDTHKLAVQKRFRGSPTVLIDGIDPFADGNSPVGLACRIYTTEHGPAGSPTLDQLHEAIRAAGKS